MTTNIFSTRIAASVAEEPRQGLHRAVFESVAKNIPRRFWPASSVPALIPQHRVPLTPATFPIPATAGRRQGIVRVNSILPAGAPWRAGPPLFLLANHKHAWPDSTSKIPYTYLP